MGPGAPGEGGDTPSSWTRPLLESYPRSGDREPEWVCSRMALFMAIHCTFFLMQVGTLVLFATSELPRFTLAIAAAMLFSTLVCTHLAMYYHAPNVCTRLPLRKQRWYVAVPLWFLLGPCQGVILILVFEDYYARAPNGPRRASSSELQIDVTTAARIYGQKVVDAKHTYSCKAVIDTFEGILSCWVIMYAYSGINFPVGNEIIVTDDPAGYRQKLGVAAYIAAFVGGIGLMESDICLSKAVRAGTCWRALHLAFRTSEVVSRMSLHVYVMVALWGDGRQLWWGPFILDFVVTITLVYVLGGCEGAFFLRYLCGLPCVFADLFFFVDVPAKRRSARKMSNCLFVRNVVMIACVPLEFFTFGVRIWPQIEADHPSALHALYACIPYWVTWAVFRYHQLRDDKEVLDIFEPCRQGKPERVKQLTSGVCLFTVDVNLYDIDGFTPLMVAATSASRHAGEVCVALIEEGARVDIHAAYDTRILRRWVFKSVRRRWTVLHMVAQKKGMSELLNELLKARHLDQTRAFLKQAAFPTGGQSQATLLHNTKVTPGLLQDTCGHTPLHVAVRYGNYKAASMLVRKIPELLFLLDLKGRAPVDVARSDDMRRLVEMSMENYRGHDAAGSGNHAVVHTAEEETFNRIFISSLNSENEAAAGASAPGLSSFLVGVAGGVQGQLFLQHLASVPEETRSPPVETPAPQYRVAMRDLEPVDAETGRVTAAVQEHLDKVNNNVNALLLTPMTSSAVLGTGAYGEVWRARVKHDHTQQYAVKVMKWSHRRAQSPVAERETEVYTKIGFYPHPCLTELVALHRCFRAQTRDGLKDGTAFVLELCVNGNLGQAMEAGVKFDHAGLMIDYSPPALCRQWVGQIFLGLEHLHIKAFALMRDLKPPNVLLDADHRCKISDYGISKIGLSFRGWGTFRTPCGSPGYAAPEVMRDEENCSWPCDIYSLGVMTWVMFSGGDVNAAKPPMPPMSDGAPLRPGSDRGYSSFYCAATARAHAADWELLQKAIADHPNQHCAPLENDVLDFVKETTHRDPNERLKHFGIRGSEFMSRLQLPVRGDSQACREWLASQH